MPLIIIRACVPANCVCVCVCVCVKPRTISIVIRYLILSLSRALYDITRILHFCDTHLALYSYVTEGSRARYRDNREYREYPLPLKLPAQMNRYLGRTKQTGVQDALIKRHPRVE